jgi:hypothetical protein
MTTEETAGEIIPVKRNIDVLLSLDTYQGMTDEEIEDVIAYKIERALKSAEIKIIYNNSMEESAARVAAYAETSQQTIQMLESILNRPLQLRTVSANE